MHSRLNMASPKGVSVGFLFLILTLSYGPGSGTARKLGSEDMLMDYNELERRLGEESVPAASELMSPTLASTDDELLIFGSIGVPAPPKDASLDGESTSFGDNQAACGHPSCGAQITGPNCQYNCPSCGGCGQSYPQPQPAYPQPQPPYPQPQPAYPQPQPPYPQPQPVYPQPQPAYPQPQPAYPQPQPAYPQPQPPYPQPQPAYPQPQPAQPTPECQPAYPPQPEPNYPPQPEPNYPPWPEPTYPPWPEPAYPPQPEPACQFKPFCNPPITGPRPTSQSSGSPTNKPNSLQEESISSPRGGLITQSPMTTEDQSNHGLRIEIHDTSDSGSMTEPLGGDIPSPTSS
ncbi:hypothetical protein L6452_28619 [Arctium lappa]|uniref:Uncharacterized protein n=1 Tax=Arctium lappa TaxID=4217 RepID=A0ACB8ZZY5_ARCLA|nr:hypothetical protein L6452_28619 [Arctium lappa]